MTPPSPPSGAEAGAPFPLSFAALVLLCATAITAACGYLAGLPELQWLAIVAGVVAVGTVALRSLRAQRDWLNPVFLIVLTAAIRIAAPALVIAWYGVPPYVLPQFPLDTGDWEQGRMLALLGLASISLGWLILPRTAALVGRSFASGLHRRFRVDLRSAIVAACCLMVGVTAIVLFLRLNFADSAAAIETGMIRRGPRVEGTSRYSMLANWMLTYGSLLTSAYLLLVRRVHWLPGMLPVLCVTAIMSIFGGRVQAMTPLVFAAILLWYRADRSRLSYFRVLAAGAAAVAVFAGYSIFMAFYRGGFGLSALRVAFTSQGLSGYRTAALWYEVSALHPYALAAHFPPGELQGATTPLVTGFVGSLMGVTGIRPGRFLITAFIGDTSRRKSEFHSGLIVDLYLNYGVTAVVVGALLFGLLLHACYRGMQAFRGSPVVLAFYSVLLWRFFWIFFEHTIGVLDIVLVIFPLMAMMLFAGRLIPPGVRAAPT